MMAKLRAATLILLATGALVATAQENAHYAAGGSAECVSCHDFGPESPVHNLMAGAHGTGEGGTGTAMRRGCEDCHGPSAGHASAPTQISPGTSFGPRWSATIAAQNEPCLGCHEDGVAQNWRHALHMVNDLTCVTCHDIHAEQDRVLVPQEQAAVCTVCHKAQKKGIHGMREIAAFNPPCSACHNPHDHESAEAELLKNDSQGCRSCHKLERMAESDRVSDKAKRYHRVMAQPERTCLECHQGVAHAPASATPATPPVAARRRAVTLFYPGLADSDWLLHTHPGSQPLRQGANCRQCHRGEEAAMGQAQAGSFEPATREIEVAFDRDEQSLRLTLQWRGEADERDIALMWGAGSGDEAFSRGGCFAACHSDLPGMSANRGQQLGKYLMSSRLQERSIGKPAIVRDAAALRELMAQDKFAVLWRVELASGKADAATVLEDVHWQSAAPIRASTSYRNGQWTVKIRRAMKSQPAQLMQFDPDGKYTFGIALHGADNPGGKHWVSLPLTFSYSGDDTDFKVD
jgi:DmsE family decaheme c-type cytochrome